MDYSKIRAEVSVVDYLSTRGFAFKRKGNKYFTNSPFNEQDRTGSFCVFPDGAYKCFSTGKVGNVITLMRHFGDSLSTPVPKVWVAPKTYERKAWNGVPKAFLTDSEEVHAYARSRGITHGYESGCFYTKTEDGFDKHLAILFPHKNGGVITGAKFRALSPIDGQRFSSSGKLGFYILSNIIESFEEPMFYLIEGEANANSLWEYFKLTGRSAVVASAGAVTSIPKELPTAYAGKLLIDYDGSEEKYAERIKCYAHLGLQPVRIILPKGEDINSLWIKGELALIDSML